MSGKAVKVVRYLWGDHYLCRGVLRSWCITLEPSVVYVGEC